MKVRRAELLLEFVDGSTKAWGWKYPRAIMTLGTDSTLSGALKSVDVRAEIFGAAYPLEIVEEIEPPRSTLELDAGDVVEGEIVD